MCCVGFRLCHLKPLNRAAVFSKTLKQFFNSVYKKTKYFFLQLIGTGMFGLSASLNYKDAMQT